MFRRILKPSSTTRPPRLWQIIGGLIIVLALIVGVLAIPRRLARGATYQGKTAAEWALQLHTNRNAKAHTDAVQALQALGPSAVPGLCAEVRNQDSATTKAYRKVAPHLPQKFKNQFRDFFLPRDAYVRQAAAAQAIELLGTNAVTAIPVLREKFLDGNNYLSGLAATTLAHLGREAVPVLIEGLASSDSMVRAHACGALRSMGAEAIQAAPALGRMLEESSGTDPWLAATTLARLGVEALPELTSRLQHTNAATRRFAALGIENAGVFGIPATPALIEALKDTDPTVREAVVKALCAVDTILPTVDRALLGALNDPNENVREAAFQGISSSRPRVVKNNLGVFTKMSMDSDPKTSAQARVALQSIGMAQTKGETQAPGE